MEGEGKGSQINFDMVGDLNTDSFWVKYMGGDQIMEHFHRTKVSDLDSAKGKY